MNILEQSKKRRMNLTDGFKNRERLSSAERRQRIQSSLEDFRTTMKSNRNMQNNEGSAKKEEKTNKIPIMRDFSFTQIEKNLLPAENENIAVENAEKSHIEKEKQIQIHEEEMDIKVTKEVKFEQPEAPQEIQKEEKKMQTEKNQTSVQKVEEEKNESNEKAEEEEKKEKSEIAQRKEEKSVGQPMFEPTYQNQQNSGLNFNYNESNYGSSNNSSAIFFTSQFKDYLNKEKEIEKFQTIEEKEAETKQEDNKESEGNQSSLKIGDEDASDNEKKLIKNKSGSLALSNNESSLKYSFVNESGVHDIISKKLDEQLVLEINHFGKDKIVNFFQKSQIFLREKFFKDFQHFLKLMNLLRKVEKREKRYYFDGFIIFKEYKFELVKNELKTDEFIKQKNEKLTKQIFNILKRTVKEKQVALQEFVERWNEKRKTNIFKVFKMIWYDSKVIRQVDLYYLSKIFAHWKTAAQKQKKKDNHLALKLYAKNLRKTYFYVFLEGIENSRRERQLNELALDFYENNLMRKYFQGWKDKCTKEHKYISLTMTSKNFFHEKKDQKWLHTRTVDFREMK